MIAKLLGWSKLNLASILGILKAVVKLLKEVLTAVVNILFPIIPSEKFKSLVLKVRAVVEKADEWLNSIQAKLLGFLA